MKLALIGAGLGAILAFAFVLGVTQDFSLAVFGAGAALLAGMSLGALMNSEDAKRASQNGK